MRTLHRFSAYILTLTILLQPVAAFGAVWGLPPSGDVSRGAFIRAAIQAFAVPVSDEKEALPYTRIPTNLMKYVRAAHDKQVLAVFGKDLKLAIAITRGEAILITAELAGLGNSGDGDTDFRDVRDGTALARAVDVTVHEEWLLPIRQQQFGVHEPLGTKEAEKMLKKASGKAGQQRKESNDPMTQETIKIKLSTKEKAPLPKSDLMQAVWQLLNDEYLYTDKLNQEEAAYKSLEGMVESLNDPYTTFFRPVKAQNFRNQINGEVTGIGAQVEDKNGILTIVTPLRGSPAEKAGLLPGDEILKADDFSLSGIGFLEAIERVRGPKGTTVKLLIRRSGNELTITVTRDTVTVPEIEITIQENIGIVKIMQFGGNTDKTLRGEMQALHDKKVKGIVLDLRNNPGGLAHAAVTVVSNFVPRGSLVYVAKSKTGSEEYATEDLPTIEATTPVILLINGGSASASEIVAGALQDHKRATLVGEKTFGKGTVQAVLQFQDLSGLKMTIAEWFTPKGRKIDKVGIEPDVKVVYSVERDDQMVKALELLRR